MNLKLPTARNLMWPILEVLRTMDRPASLSEITDLVARHLHIPEVARNMLHKDGPQTELQYRVGWALTNLRHAEAIDIPDRGYRTVTEAGLAIETESELLDRFDTLKPWPPVDTSSEDSEQDDDVPDLDAWYQARFGDKQVWLMAAGEKGTLWDTFVDDGVATVGFADIGNVCDYKSREAIKDALVATGEFGENPVNDTAALDDFANNMQIGDTIVVKKGTKSILGVGRIIGDYSYDASCLDHWHSRRVDWTPQTPPLAIPKSNQGIAKKTLTLFSPYKDWLYVIFSSLDGDVKRTRYGLEDALKELFVDEASFRRIRRTLKLRKNLILQGPPGTGKTFMARRLAWCLIGSKDSRPIEMVQFHQSYAYEDFVQGYRPTEHGGFSVRNGVFYDFCARARADEGTPYVFIIDEINRGNMSRIFGELLMLIEADKRSKQYAASLTYGKPGERFFVPPNVHILGMMNTADRSLAVVDYALRRRFAFEDLEPAFDNSKFREHLLENKVDATTVDLIQKRMQELNEKIRDDAELGRGFEIGHSYFVPGNHEEITRRSYRWYEEIVDTQIAPLLREYWFDNLEEAEHEIQKLKQD